MRLQTSVPPQGGELPPVPTPSCCPGCGVVLDSGRLSRQAGVCSCGHHFPLHADAWITLLADTGTWTEWWAHLAPRDVACWSRPRPYGAALARAAADGLNEAVRAGTCTIAERPFWLGVFDFRFMGGTLSIVAGERLACMLERAVEDRTPVLLVTASGGARMQEGPQALMQMAKVNGALSELRRAAVPYFALLSHPTYGGTAASLALLADVNLAEPRASIGFTGPRVIEQATHEPLPGDFQTAEFQLAHGQVDMIVDRSELRETLVGLHDLFDGGSR